MGVIFATPYSRSFQMNTPDQVAAYKLHRELEYKENRNEVIGWTISAIVVTAGIVILNKR
jgi:hypothetical protein